MSLLRPLTLPTTTTTIRQTTRIQTSTTTTNTTTTTTNATKTKIKSTTLYYNCIRLLTTSCFKCTKPLTKSQSQLALKD